MINKMASILRALLTKIIKSFNLDMEKYNIDSKCIKVDPTFQHTHNAL